MSIRLFPYNLQDNVSILAFSKVLDYIFQDSTFVDGAFSLPNIATTHTPAFTAVDVLLVFNQLESGDISNNVLDKLAEMFNIAGYEYIVHFTSVAAEIRAIKLALVRNGLYLSRIKGTPKSIQLSLEKFGYTSIIITENIDIPTLYDNSFTYNGATEYVGNLSNHLFSVSLTSDHNVDADELGYIIAIIDGYKKLRTELYQLTIIDPANPSGFVTTVFIL
jgi:hypothetical protein